MQIVSKLGGVRRIVEHLGSARDKVELAALMHLGRQRSEAGSNPGPRSSRPHRS